ncbi:hypothetical protein [Caballeronia sp. GAWG2-1]|uniref:hypothetical protein n=1 Tax=Caballeronia sp. GAWG2-1 TaxID=2921744 RepID=UPI002028FBAE|nr:hypothetical protein [Caballeronia sp. GAWG2-1]
MDEFPTIRLIVNHGGAIAWIVAILPFLGCLAAFALLQTSWLILLVGLVATMVLLFIMKSYVELVKVVADMLLPQ